MKNKWILGLVGLLLIGWNGRAQEWKMTQYAALTSIYGEVYRSAELLPMNEVGVESGYVLYETEVGISDEKNLLRFENVRDYAAVYLDGVYQGAVSDAEKCLSIQAGVGVHRLQLYAENIGRITYGPEILDNSKGLFGRAWINYSQIENWRIVPLGVLDVEPGRLPFDVTPLAAPCFRRGSFDWSATDASYLDVSGWGMGEVWLNGVYLGSYWNEDTQQSIRIPDDILKSKANTIVVFDLKTNDPDATLRLSDVPVFK